MAWNVWFRIWPAQQKIITRGEGRARLPTPRSWPSRAPRSRHNTYMSVPLVWGMLNAHTTYFAGGNLGIPEAFAFVVFLLVVLLGWHVVWHLTSEAGKVKGFSSRYFICGKPRFTPRWLRVGPAGGDDLAARVEVDAFAAVDVRVAEQRRSSSRRTSSRPSAPGSAR